MAETIMTAVPMEGVRAKTALKHRQKKLKMRIPEWDQRLPTLSYERKKKP